MKFFRWLTARCKKKGLHHWVTLLILLLLGALAGQFFEDSPLLASTRLWLYKHELSLQIQKPMHPSQTAVVLLGDDDFWSPAYAGRNPVNRTQIAKILSDLNTLNVQRVVLDIDLRLPQSPGLNGDFKEYAAENETLIAAIADFCDPREHPGHSLILGTSILYDDANQWYTQVPTLDQLAANLTPARSIDTTCLKHGYIQLPTDMRQVPEIITLKNGDPLDSLALAAAGVANPTVAFQSPQPTFQFSRFLDTKAFGYNWDESKPFKVDGLAYDTFTPSMIHNALPPQPDKDGIIRSLVGKVVLVGGDWHTSAYRQGPRVDQYDSALGAMPGVFLHANYIEALLDNDDRGIFASTSSATAKVFEITLILVITFLGLFEMDGRIRWAIFSTMILLTLVVIYILLVNLGIFMDFLVPLCILIGHTVFEDFLALRHEVKHLRSRFEEVSHETSE